MPSQSSGGTLAQRVPHKRGRFGFGLAPALLRRLLSCIAFGSLIVETPTGERVRAVSRHEGPEATLILHRWRALRRLATKGDIGFAEGYIDGDWSSPDLTALIQLASVNTPALKRLMRGSAMLRAVHRLSHVLRSNTRGGSRRNIAFHYDLGNDFYSLWLDRSMTYSSALYARDGLTLEAAQEEKFNRIVSMLDIQDGERVLEIGCGWGALAARLAGIGKTEVVALTLSKEQREFAVAAHRRDGVASLIDVRLQDYRDVRGEFDRIVSIEMLEAVGERFWPVYFDTVRARLKNDGRAVLQVITIDEARFEDYREGADFIQRHVFPGGMLPSKTALRREIENAGLQLTAAETFGQSYAETLAEWRIRFHRSWPDIERIGFGERFRRLWDYYLCYCEAGFRTGAIDVGLYCVTHAEKDPAS